MALGKSIDLYLMDGTADGRWQANLSNWNCNAYKIPRSELKHCDDIQGIHGPGVYFLFGRDDQSERQFVYVGEGDDVIKRIRQPHSFEKDGSYWTEAIILITLDDSLNKATIKYLENRFHKIVIDSGRYISKNGNTPTQSQVSPKIRDMLEEFILNTQLIMPALGHKVFEPQPSSKQIDKDDILYFSRNKGNGGKATGKLTEDGFWVLKGSYIYPVIADYVRSGIVKTRKQYEQFIDKNGILQKDISFGSPSYAATFVCGKNSNGLVEWKNKDGVSLKDLNNGITTKASGGSSHGPKPSIPTVNDRSDFLHLASKKIDAKGYLMDDNSFVILKGSQMSPNPRNSCKNNILNHRKKLIDNGQVKNFVFQEDVTYGSPSTAAAVIFGGEANGWEEWKNNLGQTLKEIKQKQ